MRNDWLDQYDDAAIAQQCAETTLYAILVVLGTVFAAVMVGIGLVKLLGAH